MTITYTAQVATCRHLGCFWKLLFRWKGSIYKLLWVNMLLYIFLFMSFKLMFQYMMNRDQQEVMVKIGKYCHAFEEAIPLSFLLGFYVAIVIARWWDQYLSIPWPDGLAVLISVFLTGQDVRGRVMRRTIMRYANLCMVMTFTMISPFVKRRFPNYQSYVDAGLLLPSEHQRLKDLEKRTTHPKHWVPLTWAIAIVARARREGKIADDVSKETIIMEINAFRGTCGMLLNYDWISIPLVYPQVVSWAVYTYFATTLISYQFPSNESLIENEEVLMFVPIFPMLQFFFYMGWLLVAETLANPFGEDDDDFDISWLIDRNLQVSYCIADEMHHTHPELLKDQYWDDVLPPDLPWNPHTDMDNPDDQNDDDNNKEMTSKSGEQSSNKKNSKWSDGLELPTNIAKTDFVSRSLDFGSERVIRIYLPPSLSRITFGSRPSNKSGMSKGSRPSGDSKQDHAPLRDIVNDERYPGARTQLVHNPNKGDKEEEVPRFAAAVSDYSGSRLEEDNDNRDVSEVGSNIVSQENFIYNHNRGPNQSMVNPSSRNVLHIGNNNRHDRLANSLRADSSSSLGLHLLLSENVIQRINDMNKLQSGYESSNESIVIRETSKISKNEKLLYKSKSGHKSILKTQDDKQHSFYGDVSSQEGKSARSMVKTISMPVTFGKDMVDDIEDIVNEALRQDNKDNHGRTIEFVDVYNEQYEENAVDDIRSSYSIHSDQPGNENQRVDAESSYRSLSEQRSVSFDTIADSQDISDVLFDHILNDKRTSRTSKEGKEESEEDGSRFSSPLEEPSNIQEEIKSNHLQTNNRREKIEDFIIFDSDIEPSMSDDFVKDDQPDFKSVIDEFETQESFVLRDKAKENLTGTVYNEDTCIYKIVDKISYNVISENNSICIFDETPNNDDEEIIQQSDTATDQKNASDTRETITNNVDSKQDRNGISPPSTSSDRLKKEDNPRSSKLDSSGLLNPSIDEMEEFRNKVEQSVSFKYGSLSPSQPKIISTLLQQSSPLSTVIELPEDDSDVES